MSSLDMDQSMVDINENNKASFSISEAQNGLCAYRQLDPGIGVDKALCKVI